MSKHGRENFWSCAKELNLIVILNFFSFFLVVVQQNCTVRKKKRTKWRYWKAIYSNYSWQSKVNNNNRSLDTIFIILFGVLLYDDYFWTLWFQAFPFMHKNISEKEKVKGPITYPTNSFQSWRWILFFYIFQNVTHKDCL